MVAVPSLAGSVYTRAMTAPEHVLTHQHTAQVAGHMLTLVPSGLERLTLLLRLIDSARSSIGVIYYTFADDGAGTRVRDALVAAARRGVAVSLLLDSFGSASTADSFFAPLRAAGGKARWFGTRWTPRYLIRNHQKLVVIDRATVMTGGFNIADAYFAPPQDRNGWHDIGLSITGPAASKAADWFDALSEWMDAERPRFRDLRHIVARYVSGDAPVRWLIGGPMARLSPLARAMRSELMHARSLRISTAYFSPDARFLSRLGQITRRGGMLDLVLPARSDNGATVGASRLLYRYLLKRGAHIAEFEPNRLHSKICVIDDKTVLIGSANLDMRSIYLNMELVLRVEDAGFAKLCSSIIDAQRALSTVITPALHKRRATLFNRLRWAISWLVVGFADYGVTRRLNFGLNREDGPRT